MSGLLARQGRTFARTRPDAPDDGKFCSPEAAGSASLTPGVGRPINAAGRSVSPSRPTVEETVDSTRLQGEGDSAPRPEGRLVCTFPPHLTIEADLGGHRTVFGRAPEDGVLVTHKTVSREHIATEWDSTLQTHVVRDLGSRNGSWVDSERVGAGWQPLAAGSLVRMGDVLLIYERGNTLAAMDAPSVDRDAVPGRSLAVRQLRAQIARAAPDVSPALVVGETGVGKELIARQLHDQSGRTGEFVAVNCATFGEQLIESQLFGHKKGAFTGATHDQEGLFIAARGGTLFLDEIGEMPLALQPKLLRAIQTKEIRALGSSDNQTVDVRIVAATHRNLAEKARNEEFRQDLYARLALWEINVPSLRARKSDIIGWLSHLNRHWHDERGLETRPLHLHVSAAEVLLQADWPENLRGMSRLVHELGNRRSDSPVRSHELPDWVRTRSVKEAE